MRQPQKARTNERTTDETTPRPVTTLGPLRAAAPAAAPARGAVLLRGLGASPGVVSGTVRVVRTPEEVQQYQRGLSWLQVMTGARRYIP